MSTKRKAKPKAKTSSESRFVTQAASEAFLRTNPERSTLAQQLADARSDRDTSVAASRTAANANVAAAAKAPAANRKVYDDAVARVGAAVAAPGVDDPSTGAGRDAAQTRGHLAAMLAAANDDATSRQLSAREGDQYAVGKANSTYAGTAGTLNARLRALAQEEGVFTQGRAADLTGEDVKLRHDSSQKAADRRNAADIAAGHDETSLSVADKRTQAGKAKGIKPASADSVKQLRSSASTGKGAAADLKTAGFSRAEADKLLARGQKGSAGGDVYETVKTNSGTKQQKVLNPDGTAKKGGAVPEIPSVADPLARSIALDLAYDGGISRANVRKLLNLGVAPGQFAAALGAQTQTQRGAKPKRSAPAKLSPSERAPGGT